MGDSAETPGYFMRSQGTLDDDLPSVEIRGGGRTPLHSAAMKLLEESYPSQSVRMLVNVFWLLDNLNV